MIVLVQLAFSVLLTASIMPVVLIAAPGMRSEPHIGFALMAGIWAVSIAVIAALWPKRRK